jgi:hypothetical protein
MKHTCIQGALGDHTIISVIIPTLDCINIQEGNMTSRGGNWSRDTTLSEELSWDSTNRAPG